MSSNTEWLTPDIIEELLLNDMEDEEPCSSKVEPSKQSKPAPVSISLTTVQDLVAEVDASVHLSSYGEKEIKHWMENFAQYKDAEIIVAEYGKKNGHAVTFFVDVKEVRTIKLLLEVVRKIVSPKSEADELTGGEITAFENDTLEYLGGYTLKKVMAKFPNKSFFKHMCRDKPFGSLIPLMEKRAGSLLCPSHEYLMLVRHVYLKFCCESSNSPSNINFDKAAEAVITGRYFKAFVNRIENRCTEDLEEDEVEAVATHAVRLLVRVLSYGFAKKLFARLKTKRTTALSAGLRGDLKRQIQD